MTTATEPGTNGHAHQPNGHAPASRLAGILPLPPVSDGDAMPKPAAGGRGDGGRFAPGNKIGRGNPFTRKLAARRAAFADAVTDADLAELARKLYKQALDGDLQAAALLLNYAIGKPSNAVDPDALDLDEWKRLDAAPTLAQVIRAFLDNCDPAGAAEVYKRLQPLATDKIHDKLQEGASYTLNPAVMEERKARVGK